MRFMDWLDRMLNHTHICALIEAVGGFFLISSTSVMVAYHVALGAFSLISVACGAILGLHAVCKLVLPICRRREAPKLPRDAGASSE